MNQPEFERRHAALWERLDRLCTMLAAGQSGDVADFPREYRLLCQQLAVARGRLYGLALIERLEQLALRCHHQLYGGRRSLPRGLLNFLLLEFPAAIRAHRRAVLLAMLFFFGPALIVIAVGQSRPEVTHAVLGGELLQALQQMYDPSADQFQTDRAPGTDVGMFGFYIEHNIGIGLICFAMGLFWGLGSIAALVYNGLVLGAASVYVVELGYQSTFFPFIIGHGAFELPAIVLMGAAGLDLGLALLSPKRLTRGEALRTTAHSVLPLVLGGAAMLVMAATLEAFWSPRPQIPIGIKYTLGTLLWLLVAAHWLLAGRRHAA